MSGKPPAFSASLQIFIEAIADSGVFGDGFQMVMSPQAAATNAFHAHTATGKLNAEMTPTIPIGCHCSYMRWPGRSECMVKPYSWRDRPDDAGGATISNVDVRPFQQMLAPVSADAEATGFWSKGLYQRVQDLK